MRRLRTRAAAAAFSILVAPMAPAELLQVTIEPYVGEGWIEHGYENLQTYRIYAIFDLTGDDGVLAVFGEPGDPMQLASYTEWFYNDSLAGGLTAPLDATSGGYWANQWDTYVTINATQSAGDATNLSDGFAEETNGLCTNWSTDNAGWFVTPQDPQSMADADGRVLLGQFTILNGPAVWFATILLRDGTEADIGLGCDFEPCPGDVNGSGARDTADVIAVISAWGACNGCPEDSDCSDRVDFEDLLTVLGNWGECSFSCK